MELVTSLDGPLSAIRTLSDSLDSNPELAVASVRRTLSTRSGRKGGSHFSASRNSWVTRG